MSDLVERLRWHSEDQATGKLRLTNPDGPEAADEIEALEAENARLREALEFYADLKTYETQYVTRECGCCEDYYKDIENDEGTRARAALAEQEPRDG
jgi:hypothetical protein